MSDIIQATYNLLDYLDDSNIIKNLTKYKTKLLNNKEILKEIELFKKTKDKEKQIAIRKSLYNNKDYSNYMKYYNELYYIILKINKKYAEYTNTKESGCHG